MYKLCSVGIGGSVLLYDTCSIILITDVMVEGYPSELVNVVSGVQ